MSKVMNLRTVGDNLREQIKTGNIHLLSELNLNSTEVELIRSSVGRLIESALAGRDIFDIQTAYLMMDIGMRFYNDGTYWDDFWKQVGVEHSPKQQDILGTFFNETIAKYNLATAETHGRKYVNMILMHAFIPEKYSDHFFDFVQKYYRVVLKGAVQENLDSQLGVFEEVFREDNATDLYPELKNVQLIVPTKLALTRREYYASILTRIIRRISNDYESDDDVRLGVYEEPFKKWTQKEKVCGKTHSEISSLPSIRYDMNRNELYVVIPPQILDPKNGMVCVIESSGGGVLKQFNVTSYSQFHNMISDEKEFRLDWNPLDKFKILIGERVLYENANKGVIFFNKNGQKRSKVSLGFNMVVVPKDAQIDAQTSEMAEGNDYVIRGFLMTRGDKVSISGQTYVIEEEVLESLHITSDCLDIDCTDQDGNSYNVYSCHPTISLSLSQERKARLKFSIGRGYDRITYDSVDDLISDPSVRCEDDSNYVIDISQKGLSCENGVYTIRYRGRDVFRYALLNGFSYNFEKELYETDEDSKLFYTGNFDGIVFNTTQGVVELPKIDVDGRELFIRVQVPSRRFSFDTKKWMLFNSEELYFRNVEGKQFFVYCPTLVFPQITVMYKDSKPLILEIQGIYLTCEFSKVNQIGALLENGRMYKPTMMFKCGRFDLFTIRYSADYSLSPGRITRINAPINTYAVCEYATGEGVRFKDDIVILPFDNINAVDVYEYYANDFGEQKRFAFHANTQPRLRTSKDSIQNGDTPRKLKVDFNGETVLYDWDQVNYLISLDDQLDIDSCNYVRHYFSAIGSNKHSIELYDSVCELIKDAILSDESTDRLKKRIQRFKDVDVDFAIKLCKRCLEIRSDGGVIYQLSYLEQSKKDSKTEL
ncbi:MAG: hypothetical protein PHG86_04060 [Candidatus Methanomethylophilaceae archaeon]|nr:hypothetical protein [Candidatus Methanomethylophilaceae archaeon]